MVEFFKRIRAYFIQLLMKTLNFIYCNDHKVVLDNFEGRGYGDNPKYIAEELLSRHAGFDLVWVVRKKTNYSFPNGIRTVNVNSLRMIIELATAKFWIDNCRKPRYVGKTKKQKYIQTWHGFYPLKMLEKDAQKSLPDYYINQAKHDSEMTDLMLSGCRLGQIFRNLHFGITEKLQNGGTQGMTSSSKNLIIREKYVPSLIYRLTENWLSMHQHLGIIVV